MSGDKPSVEPPKINNPRIFADPDTIRFRDLYKYVGLDMHKMSQSVRNYKGSLPYIGGLLGACLVYKLFLDGAANYHIFGKNGNGGDFLNMYTLNNTYDYYYNREFQRMRYLAEEVTGNDKDTQTSDTVLADLGYKITAPGLNRDVVKKAPHFKYY